MATNKRSFVRSGEILKRIFSRFQIEIDMAASMRAVDVDRQFAGLGSLAVGLVDYFALGNVGGSASPLFTLGIFLALLGIALQRKA